jgi:hypothetical protein
MRTTIVVRFVYDASAASSDASGRGPDEVERSPPPFDSMSYTRRIKIVVRGAFPIEQCRHFSEGTEISGFRRNFTNFGREKRIQVDIRHIMIASLVPSYHGDHTDCWLANMQLSFVVQASGAAETTGWRSCIRNSVAWGYLDRAPPCMHTRVHLSKIGTKYCSNHAQIISNPTPII